MTSSPIIEDPEAHAELKKPACRWFLALGLAVCLIAAAVAIAIYLWASSSAG
jgi:hypothetical protein